MNTNVLVLKNNLTLVKCTMKISFIIQYLLHVREFTFERISINVQNIARYLAVICHCISMRELVLQKYKEYSKAFTCFSYFNCPQKLHTGEKLHIQVMCQTFNNISNLSQHQRMNSVSFTVWLHISLHFVRKDQVCACLDRTNLQMCL